MFQKSRISRVTGKTVLPAVAGIIFLCAGPAVTPVYAGNSSQPMQAQAQVSMTLYQLQTGADGKQYAIGKDGSMVPLPPPGMAPGAPQVAVYSDGKGNFWYQSPNGMAVPVTDNRLTWTGSASQAATKPEESKKSKWQERRSKRRGMLGSFLGAATGAAVGTAVTNSMYGVPYGTPIYGNPNSMYYVGPNGSQVYLNLDDQALNSLYNQWTVQQQLVQQNRLNYQQQAQQSALQFQQQAQQNSVNHQAQVQQSWLNTQQQAIDNRQNAAATRQSQNQENRSARSEQWQTKRQESLGSRAESGRGRWGKAQEGTAGSGARASQEGRGRFGRRSTSSSMGAESAGRKGRFGRRGGSGSESGLTKSGSSRSRRFGKKDSGSMDTSRGSGKGFSRRSGTSDLGSKSHSRSSRFKGSSGLKSGHSSRFKRGR